MPKMKELWYENAYREFLIENINNRLKEAEPDDKYFGIDATKFLTGLLERVVDRTLFRKE